MGNERDRVPERGGEGNREADRRYREATKSFISRGDVEEAAREAQRALDQEPDELEAAERESRSHIAEEDPEVRKR
jgi:hypothetical protein